MTLKTIIIVITCSIKKYEHYSTALYIEIVLSVEKSEFKGWCLDIKKPSPSGTSWSAETNVQRNPARGLCERQPFFPEALLKL